MSFLSSLCRFGFPNTAQARAEPSSTRDRLAWGIFDRIPLAIPHEDRTLNVRGPAIFRGQKAITHSKVQINAESRPISGAPPPRQPLIYNGEPLCPAFDDINSPVCKLRQFYLSSFQCTESRHIYYKADQHVFPAGTPYPAHPGPY